MRTALALDPLSRRERLSLLGSLWTSEERSIAVTKQGREKLPNAFFNALPVAALPVVRRGILVQQTSRVVVARGGLNG